ERFYDVGIAEPHAVTFAAGLASQGLRPVVAIYSTFLQRSYDEIIHDVCLQNLPVVFAIDRSGIVGEDGATHQGLFDISYLRHIPNLILMSPKDANELREMLFFALGQDRPTAIRYPRAKVGSEEEIVKISPMKFSIEMGKAEILREGEDIAIIAVGNTVSPSLKAAGLLRKDGISASVVNARFLKPFDMDMLSSISRKVKGIVTVEENMLAGGFGSMALESLNNAGLDGVKALRIGIADEFVEHGSQKILRKKYGLDEEGIYNSIVAWFKRK
ncbi:MAG: 1-deoxy-D-xylulose-5-phosphate synthase, partial [Nitrospirae bacterium]|nr:1-deoxy-D-xylulose-5-phosphate synthase [Nitrospirota bacterium]